MEETKYKVKSYEQILSRIKKIVNEHFTEEEQEFIEWDTDTEKGKLYYCHGVNKGKKFTIVLDRELDKISLIYN